MNLRTMDDTSTSVTAKKFSTRNNSVERGGAKSVLDNNPYMISEDGLGEKRNSLPSVLSFDQGDRSDRFNIQKTIELKNERFKQVSVDYGVDFDLKEFA